MPFPYLRRLGVALVPVEALRALAQAAHQVAVGELLGRIAGYDLGLVEDAERDRVEAQLLGHFVHRHFQRHVARCFSRRAHCIAFGHVERGDVVGHQAVGACIELGRLQGAVLAVLAVDVARPVLMGDSGDTAVFRATDPDALDGRVPVRGVVGHQRALQRDLHRPPDLLGGQCSQHRIGADEQLAAEAAAEQLQTCAYGDVLEMASRMIEAGHILDPTTARLLFELADECADSWMRKDSGFWELGDAQHYTMSKVECWMALRRACELAEAGHITTARLPRWQREKERILDWVDAHCWNEAKQSYVMHAGSDRLDASLMLASRFGLGDVRRERFISTREAMRRELSDDSGDLLWRYSGMQDCESTFISCAFWMVEAYGLLGEKEEASRLFGALLARVQNDVSLMPEMWDPHQEQGLGNTPQGLSHLALVHAAYAVDGE